MGTNYYLRTDVCQHCQREEHRIHVGKASMGWPFLFRGYRQYPPDGVPYPITSAAQWWDFLERSTAGGGALVDEYGERQSVPHFRQYVESKRDETRGPETCNFRHGDRPSEWLDGDGYRFCDNEFS